MKKFTAYVTGKVQKTGYRAKVVTIARAFGLTVSVKNPVDERVKKL